jgi:coatomer protein complex subunit gamma
MEFLAVGRSLMVWFYRCLDDVDDEVRDRAAMYLRVMKEEPLAEKLVKEGESSASASE